MLALIRKTLLLVVGLAACVFLYITIASPVSSVAWLPPSAPGLQASNAFAPNNKLQKARLHALGNVYGPEDVAIGADGLIYGGTQDGKIVRITPDNKMEVFVETELTGDAIVI